MDPLVGAEGPAGVAGAVGGVPGGVQGGYHILTLCHSSRAGKGLIDSHVNMCFGKEHVN